MWWKDDADDTRAAPHMCNDACTRAVRGSWICTHTGAVLGPSLLEATRPRTISTPVKNRADCTPAARGRFLEAIQDLLSKLLSGVRRVAVEGARAEKARTVAVRAASASIAADAAEGRLANVGLCHGVT